MTLTDRTLDANGCWIGPASPRTARPLDLTNASQEFQARFWSKVAITGPADCWEWTGSRKTPDGYGQFSIRHGVPVHASRVCLAMQEPLEPGDLACHHCDNPPCVNPSHLFKGTASENANDAAAKGRLILLPKAHGERHSSARLTEEDVRYIRSQDVSVRGTVPALARRFGVSISAVQQVASRATWKHVL